MNTNKIRIAFFNKNILARYYSVPLESTKSRITAKISNNVNGMTVITINPAVTISSKIIAIFSGGSRYENYDTKGMNHMLRRNFGLSSLEVTPVSTVRHFQQMGCDAKCIGTREALVYSLDFGKSLTKYAGLLLAQATTNQTFYHWEIRDHVKPQMNVDYEYLIRKDFDTLCSELLHKAAYRDGLGNSLIVNPTRMNDFTFDDIKNFTDRAYSAGNCTLIGISVDQDELTDLAHYFTIRPMENSGVLKPVFRGGDRRRELPLDLARVMMVWEGPGILENEKAVATSILSYAIDTGVNEDILWNNGEQEMLRKLDKCIDVRQASCILNMYSDSSLLGFTLAGGRNDSYDKAMKILMEHLHGIGKNGISKEAFNIARNLLCRQLTMNGGSREALIDIFVSQAGCKENFMTIPDMVEYISNMTLETVNKVANEIFTSKKIALAAVGDLRNVPYLDDLI